MEKDRGRRSLVPSLLDRLIQGSASPLRGHTLTQLREGVRRDLEDLLNTRRRCFSWPSDLRELDVSLVNYGIPDFTGVHFGSPDSQEEFRRVLQRAIERFEPRLARVAVTLVKDPQGMDRTLRFRIEAVLRTRPVPEQVVFDSTLEPLSAAFEVKEGAG